MAGPDDPRWTAVLGGLARAGVDLDQPTTVVRDGAALLVRAGTVLVRVRSAGEGLGVARREVEVARILVDRGVPAISPAAGDDQPWAMDGSVVTAWTWVEAAGPAAPRQLGTLARTLRELTADDGSHLAACDPIDAILAAVAHLGPDQADAVFVRHRAEDLAGPWADAASGDPLGRAVVHGDLHAGNVVVGADGPLLTDFELTGGGPSSYDAAPAAVAVRRYGAPEASLDAFIEAFGADPRSWSGFATFVDTYELWVAAWAVGVGHLDPSWEAEATRRVASLRDGVDHRWQLS